MLDDVDCGDRAQADHLLRELEVRQAGAVAGLTPVHGDEDDSPVGGLAVTTHTTKLGLRYAVDASPEPVSNGVMSISELGLVTAIMLTIWSHPYITLAVALIALFGLIILVRLIWRTLRQVLSGRWVPHRGFRQEARTSDRLENREED